MSMKPPQVNKQKVDQWIESLKNNAKPNELLKKLSDELHFAQFDTKNPAENYIEWLLAINTNLNLNTVADHSAYKEQLKAFGEKILNPLLSKLNAKNVAYTEAEYEKIKTISKIYGISINILKELIPQTQAQAEKATPATPVSASTTAAGKISVPQAPSLGEQALPASAKPVSMATQPKQQQPSAAQNTPVGGAPLGGGPTSPAKPTAPKVTAAIPAQKPTSKPISSSTTAAVTPAKTNATTTNTQQQKSAQAPPLPTTKPPGKQATKPASGTNTTVTPPSVTASKSTQTAVAKAQTPTPPAQNAPIATPASAEPSTKSVVKPISGQIADQSAPRVDSSVSLSARFVDSSREYADRSTPPRIEADHRGQSRQSFSAQKPQQQRLSELVTPQARMQSTNTDNLSLPKLADKITKGLSNTTNQIVADQYTSNGFSLFSKNEKVASQPEKFCSVQQTTDKIEYTLEAGGVDKLNNIRLMLMAASIVNPDVPLWFSGGTKEDVIAFNHVSKHKGIPIHFDPISEKFLNEAGEKPLFSPNDISSPKMNRPN